MFRRAGVCAKILLVLVALFFVLPTPVRSAAVEEMTIAAAASLTDVFTILGREFQKRYPGVKVLFDFASSGSLLCQIERGAPIDLFASADSFTMDEAEAKGLIVPASRLDFALNSLVLIVPKSSKRTISGLKDLSGPAVSRIAVGSSITVPAGRYAEKLLKDRGVWKQLLPKYINADSVRQVLDYVRRGEVDAGIVYRTDAFRTGGEVRIVERVGRSGVVRYPIAMVRESGKGLLAGRWIAFLTSKTGRGILVRSGFELPVGMVQPAGQGGRRGHED